MLFEEYKELVQAVFPVTFSESLILSEDATGIDKILNLAIRKACSKFEKIEGTELVGSQSFTRAESILKCVPTTLVNRTKRNLIWDTMNIPREFDGGVRHYFGPDRFLRLWPADETVWVEYVVAADKLTVADLNNDYILWAVEYGNALLKIKEGYLGTSAVLTALPFEFNYKDMKDAGEKSKEDLETRLDDMYSGTLSIRAN